MSDALGVLDARSRFSELIDRAEKGEEITITRRGRAVARIVPADPKPRRTPEQIAAIKERLRVMRDEIEARCGLTTQAEIKAWINEGRH